MSYSYKRTLVRKISSLRPQKLYLLFLSSSYIHLASSHACAVLQTFSFCFSSSLHNEDYFSDLWRSSTNQCRQSLFLIIAPSISGRLTLSLAKYLYRYIISKCQFCIQIKLYFLYILVHRMRFVLKFTKKNMFIL